MQVTWLRVRPVLEGNYWVKLNIVDVIMTHCPAVAMNWKKSPGKSLDIFARALIIVIIVVKLIISQISGIYIIETNTSDIDVAHRCSIFYTDVNLFFLQQNNLYF